MRQFKNYSFLLLLILFLVACKKDDDGPDTNNRGIEFFECKINGEPFEAVSDFTCTGPRFEYYPEPYLDVPAGYMSFGGRDCRDDRALYINFFGMNQDAHGFDQLENMSYADSCTPVFFFSDLTIYQNLIDGSLNIEEFTPRASGNSPLGIIKGTFELRITDEQDSETLTITEGRFFYYVPQIF